MCIEKVEHFPSCNHLVSTISHSPPEYQHVRIHFFKPNFYCKGLWYNLPGVERERPCSRPSFKTSTYADFMACPRYKIKGAPEEKELEQKEPAEQKPGSNAPENKQPEDKKPAEKTLTIAKKKFCRRCNFQKQTKPTLQRVSSFSRVAKKDGLGKRRIETDNWFASREEFEERKDMFVTGIRTVQTMPNLAEYAG